MGNRGKTSQNACEDASAGKAGDARADSGRADSGRADSDSLGSLESPCEALSDADLCQRARLGDTVARDALVERHRGLLVWFARRYSGVGVELGDLLGEAYLGAYRAIDTYDCSLGKFGSYLGQWVRAFVGAARQRTDLAADREVGGTDLDEYGTDVASDWDLVRESVTDLPALQCRLVTYIYRDGLTRTETAIKLGVCRDTVWRIERAALKALRKRLLDP